MRIPAIGAVVAAISVFALGAAVGILFAPASGERTRRKLVRRGEDLGARASDALQAAGDLAERARHQLA
jgi:gas vesicle protein